MQFLLCYYFMMIITIRNFSLSSFVITSRWSLYTASFPLPPLLKLHDDYYKPQLFVVLLCYNFMIIITNRNFSTSSFLITSWSLQTATFPFPPFLKLHDDHYIPKLLHLVLCQKFNNDDHYIPQLLHFLLCYNLMMIISYGNFSLSSFVITLWWSLHTATFPLPPML